MPVAHLIRAKATKTTRSVLLINIRRQWKPLPNEKYFYPTEEHMRTN